MADKFIQLNSFKFGLDSRREELSSLPGTLFQLINAFINEGGEIEQRKSFVKDAHTYPSNTFGLQDTDTGLKTFGSAATPIPNVLPTGVTYQQLGLILGHKTFRKPQRHVLRQYVSWIGKTLAAHKALCILGTAPDIGDVPCEHK